MRSKDKMEQANKCFKRAASALLSHGRAIPYQLFNNWGVVEHRLQHYSQADKQFAKAVKEIACFVAAVSRHSHDILSLR